MKDVRSNQSFASLSVTNVAVDRLLSDCQLKKAGAIEKQK
jgi:hypothetical protein